MLDAFDQIINDDFILELRFNNELENYKYNNATIVGNLINCKT